jgi:ABC-type sugar transport system substrate-binding protein
MCFRLRYTLPLGALRAFQEAGRANDCAIVGNNAEPEARVEMRTANTRLIASVAFFPEKYRDGLIRLALDILSRKSALPAVFPGHQVITPENVDHLPKRWVVDFGVSDSGYWYSLRNCGP